MLALAEALVPRGHRVTFLSQPSVRRRAEAIGCTFVAFSEIPDYESRAPLEGQLVAAQAITGTTTGDDVDRVAKQHGIDAVIVDANLAGALAAAERLSQPSAVLLHSMYKTFVDTWFADLWPFLGPAINETRTSYGLAPADDWPSVFEHHDRLLAVVPTVFDAPVADVPNALHHFGFLVPRGTSTTAAATFPRGDDPTVLVGLSTTYMHHETLLGAIIEALADLDVRALVTTAGQVDADALPRPANVTITDVVPHALVLGETDVMVTHAGLGSVASALTFGVPLVCTPLSRDQPLNAQRVAALNAGVVLSAPATATEIAAAVEELLANASYRTAAGQIAAASRAQGGPDAAAAELEALLD